MFGHQNDQQPYDATQASDQVVNDVTPPPQPPTFTPPQQDAASVPPHQSFNPPSDSPVTVPSDTVAPADDSILQPAHDASTTTNDLLDIKQQALNQLSPLVGHLEQTPEEKFRTTMMMIQASDNQSLIKDAYAAAQQISNEKVKAQALLDVVNEINYFTQHQEP